MLTYLFSAIFILLFLVVVLYAKKDLYVNQHEADIQKELNTFDENIKALEAIEIANYKLGSNHIYK